MIRPLLLTCALLALPAWSAGLRVSLNGTLGPSTALLVIEGQVRSVRIGQTIDGVRLIGLSDDGAMVEFDGQRQLLRLGALPVSQGTTSSQQKIVLGADEDGHFTGIGMINGQTMRFMIDTGATAVAIGVNDAQRMGLRYRNGRQVWVQTANGRVPGHVLTLDRVRIGDVEVPGVEAIVTPQPMNLVLIGNSFLKRFQMQRENEVLTLERRY
ncbi:retropepsin-like aspartic protease family protein [Inhella gelatinilytica]|uniref:Retroviral-like aspartic protease family protein n=1 Tax=Inhella gelatinilytica TaxID=2795030 RepID=A0A931ND78_9BURK|nr:retropepsin-like aspartic protease [Inhella gelatinilytica]MBH9552797.1 retroviral-like aspartic protease family protein [Inhella gelatinilytica]